MKKQCNFYFNLGAVCAMLVLFLLGGGGIFTSCNLSDSSNNTVRLVMPGGSARYVQIDGASDVDYYNVTINNQKFERLNAGASVESSPITVGAEVRVIVEAIGNIKNKAGTSSNDKLFENERRVAYFETTRTMENGGINISVKMGDYKTKYHTVTLYPNGFDSREPEEIYVADGSSYTLPYYGIIPCVDEWNPPKKHNGWNLSIDGMNNPPFYPVGASVTITEDTTFRLQQLDGIWITTNPNGNERAKIEVNASIYSDTNGKFYIWKGQPFILPKGTKTDDSPVESWTVKGQQYNPGQKYEYDLSWETSGCSTYIQLQPN